MNLDTAYYERCIKTLEKAYALLLQANPENIDYDMYRSACVKEFEIILEQSGKLLRKILKPYFHSPKEVDKLVFKDIFRWLEYRDNRNNTSYDYGVNFAEETLTLLPRFIEDATALAQIIKQKTDADKE